MVDQLQFGQKVAWRPVWRGLVRSLRRMYTRGEKESRHREIELGYDEDTFEEILVTNIVGR